ncbi:(2Fe-2S) ferredoxin domain-containing protein [Carboxylicivirga sp. N1Y90]|uniref:(2Fe-2S) ferredoxin domain-containing protein n=1 Tax=Carboxylicivirga fragile TaxID=3417571 RepID=UPI003D33CFC3|nr:(2Fe-2S) ferredoxin domain-containing protein [Marinilabiliaceae bacterium N1Y90]
MSTTGTHKILICLGSSCYSRGNADNLTLIKDYLDENGLDASIDFRGHLCSETCNKGPVIEIDETEYEGVTQSNIHSILANHL